MILTLLWKYCERDFRRSVTSIHSSTLRVQNIPEEVSLVSNESWFVKTLEYDYLNFEKIFIQYYDKVLFLHVYVASW